MSETNPSIHSLLSDSKQIFLSYLSKINWKDECRLILTAITLATIIILLLHHLFSTPPWQRLASWTTSHIPPPPPSTRSPPGPIYARPSPRNDSTRRTAFTDDSVAIYGWPSRGGVIVLTEATHVDFEFLGLSTVEPPCRRNDGSDRSIEMGYADGVEWQEDKFCQRLLLLGAKWWDCVERFRFVNRLDGGFEPAVADVEEGRVEEPTLRERRWVRVGWEGRVASAAAEGMCYDRIGEGGDGDSDGLWVLDCDTNMIGILEEDNLVPIDAGRLCLARSMRERCEILKRLGATFYGDLKDYRGEATFLRAWEWKSDGEIGEMAKYQ